MPTTPLPPVIPLSQKDSLIKMIEGHGYVRIDQPYNDRIEFVHIFRYKIRLVIITNSPPIPDGLTFHWGSAHDQTEFFSASYFLIECWLNALSK